MSPRPTEILLVEDNPNDIELALYAFRKHHLDGGIQVARDGAEALDYLFGPQTQAGLVEAQFPRVILLDLKLPKIDGLEVLRQVKGDARTCCIPVVVLSSSRREQDINQCYLLGANSFIVKPIDFEEFIEAASVLGAYWLQYNQPPLT